VLGNHGLKDEITSNIYGGPPFNKSDIASDGADNGWQFGIPPSRSATTSTAPTTSCSRAAPTASKTGREVVVTRISGDLRDDISPTVRTDGKGLWLVAWTSRGSLGSELGIDGDILLSRSTDNGATWSVPSTINQGAREDWGTDVDVRLAHDANGNWLAVWSSTETFGGKYGGDSDIFTASSPTVA
jgi:hypothetical protein